MQHLATLSKDDAAFGLHVAPNDIVAHPGWQQARAALLAAIGAGGAAVLIGQPGCGKTLLLNDIARTLRQAGTPVRFHERGNAAGPMPEPGTVLLVDEAGHMGADQLNAVCAVPSPVVLAALPGFQDRLAGLPRTVAAIVLEPLSPEGVARFVAARLAAVGQPRDLIEPEGVLALARHSGGLPRLVNVIGGAAMFLAQLDGSARVGAAHVAEAASMRDGMDGEEAPPALGEPEPAGTAPLLPAPAAHVPEAASMRDGMDAEQAALALDEPEPTGAVPLLPAHVAAPRRRALLGAAVAGLGLTVMGGWALRGRSGALPAVQAAGNAGGPADAIPPPAVQAVASVPSVAEAPPDAGQPSSLSPDVPPARQATPPYAATPQRRVERPASPPVAARQEPALPSAPTVFRGPIYNDTMGQGGQVRLVLRRLPQPGAVTARFDASAGLLGSGELTGVLSDSGRLSVSGQLMVGRNAFTCDLRGVVAGGTLTGSANFVRVGGTAVSHSNFTLARA